MRQQIQPHRERSGQPRETHPAAVVSHAPLFTAESLSGAAGGILLNFDNLVQKVKPLNARQMAKLPQEIRTLSHELTDDRPDRRVGYMNETARLSAYVRYFMWWNLVRLTRLLARPDMPVPALTDGSACLDIGSGPLTVPTALWLARPELRRKKLIWYCLDISQSSLALGEELYLAAAAATMAEEPDLSPWKIIRVKGEAGTGLRQKVSFVTCANMFNELLQRSDMPPDYLAKKYAETLIAYTVKNDSSIFVVEPGVPRSARLLSLLRDALMRRNFRILSPCPHAGTCPMDGKPGNKWCNFAFPAGDAPAKLLDLSAQAGIPKERAVLSFLLATDSGSGEKKGNLLELRIVSDPIWLPGNRTGFYACSDLGLVLAVNAGGKPIASGDLLTVSRPEHPGNLGKDPKTGAVELEL
jgi:hypothetical protein